MGADKQAKLDAMRARTKDRLKEIEANPTAWPDWMVKPGAKPPPKPKTRYRSGRPPTKKQLAFRALVPEAQADVLAERRSRTAVMQSLKQRERTIQVFDADGGIRRIPNRKPAKKELAEAKEAEGHEAINDILDRMD